MLTPGTRVDRYELVSLLGEGGMAQVWAARQEGKHGFKKLFALKAIHHRFADDPQFHRMFLDEARIAAEIEHPNVAQVFDLGEHGNVPYLVMEYVDGESLAAILAGIAKKTGKLATVPVSAALRIAADVCAGLNAAHKLVGSTGALRGVVHRDVSPQNVLLSVKGDVKLIDFGIAHAADRVAENTGVDSLKGKLRYMAPEQARRQPIGPFTDVWAVGAMLYRMLSGRSPFEAPTEVDTMALLLSGAAPTPLPESVPALVVAIVERAMAPDPADRYASAGEMGTALEAALGYEGFVADVSTWVRTNLTDRYLARRDALAARDALPSSSSLEAAAAASPAAAAMDKTLQSAAAPHPLPFAETHAAPEDKIPSLVVPEKEKEPPPISSSEIEEVHITLQSVGGEKRAPPVPMIARVEKPPTPIEVKITRSTSLKEAGAADEPEPRSFMDVRAIQAERIAEVQEAAEKAQRGEEPDEAEPAPKATKTAAQLKLDEERARDLRRKKVVAAGALGGVIVVGLLGVLLALPSIVRSQVTSAARAAGIDLTIGDVSATISGGELRDLTARTGALPGVEVAITSVRWTGLLSATDIRISGGDVKVKGSADDVAARVRRFYDDQRRQLVPSGHGVRKVALTGFHVVWTEAFGTGSRVEAGEIGMDVASGAVGSEVITLNAGRFEIATSKTVMGPWSLLFENNVKSTRVRVMFDPLLPDGPNAVYMWGPGTKPHLTVKIPRTSFAQIGLRPQELGLPVEASSDVEIRLDGGPTPNNTVEGAGKIELHGVKIAGWRTPVDIRAEGSASGPAGHPLALANTAVDVGPFRAFLLGTIAPYDRGLRLDATWKTQPIPCERLAKAEAKNMGPLAATIQEIAHNTGALRVTGSAYATGTVKADTAAPDAVAVGFQTRETCGITLFGQ